MLPSEFINFVSCLEFLTLPGYFSGERFALLYNLFSKILKHSDIFAKIFSYGYVIPLKDIVLVIDFLSLKRIRASSLPFEVKNLPMAVYFSET